MPVEVNCVGGEHPADNNRTMQMLTAIIITIVIAAALGYAQRGGRDGGIIIRRPYNNRYNDASGAREDTILD